MFPKSRGYHKMDGLQRKTSQKMDDLGVRVPIIFGNSQISLNLQAEARQAAKAEAKPSPAKVEEQVDGMGLKGEPVEVGSLSYYLQGFGDIYPNGGWAEP